MAAPPRPRLLWLATGGTVAAAGRGIAYRAGALSPESLLEALPEAGRYAELELASPYAIDSKDATPQHWLRLHTAITEALARPEFAGLVVSHGTDTLEETATLLALTLAPTKPVVLTGAMRPPAEAGADGPRNLLHAIRLAADPDTPPGVFLVFGEEVFPALGLRKAHTLALQPFAAEPRGALGTTFPWLLPPIEARPSPLPIPPSWPTVALLAATALDAPEALRQAQETGAAAAVLLLPGHGSVPELWEAAIADATASGLLVVRASRCALGPVLPHPVDERLGTLPAGILSAPAARVAAALAASFPREERQALWRARFLPFGGDA
ncbi:asparaginase domain-containing protein [Tepidiphilus sp. J10]|uniref:asparaginase domain-containing protein n=1 Tax=Tepidiphilus sp. J10 TaxID=2502185 RepID=UPI00163D7654|nr:asparaginase domain-containing protein [Tepidiphilus sp. J10]